MVFGTWGVAKVAFEGGPLGAGPDELTLWGGILLVAMIAGAWAAKLARSLALWECYLAVLVSAGLFTVELAVGWERFLGLQDTTLGHEFGLFGVMVGALLLGSMTLVALVTLERLWPVSLVRLWLPRFLGRRKAGWPFDMEWMISRRHLPAEVAPLGHRVGCNCRDSSRCGCAYFRDQCESGYQLDIQEDFVH